MCLTSPGNSLGCPSRSWRKSLVSWMSGILGLLTPWPLILLVGLIRFSHSRWWWLKVQRSNTDALGIVVQLVISIWQVGLRYQIRGFRRHCRILTFVNTIAVGENWMTEWNLNWTSRPSFRTSLVAKKVRLEILPLRYACTQSFAL